VIFRFTRQSLFLDHTGSGNRFEKFLDLWSAVDEFVVPKLEDRILYQLNKRNQQTPRVRSIDNQPLQQHPRDLLLNGLSIGFGKQAQQYTAKVMCVTVGIAELIGDGVNEQVTTLRIQVDGQTLENVHIRGMTDCGHGWRQSFSLNRLNSLGSDV